MNFFDIQQNETYIDINHLSEMLKSRHFFHSVMPIDLEFDQQFFLNLSRFNSHIIKHNESSVLEFDYASKTKHKFDLIPESNIWLHTFELEITSTTKVVAYLQYNQLNIIIDLIYNENSKKYDLYCNNIPFTFKSGEMTDAYLVIRSIDTNLQTKLTCQKTKLHQDINDIPGIHAMYLFNSGTKTNLLTQNNVWLEIKLHNLKKFMNSLTQKIKDKYDLISTSPSNTVI